MNPWGAAIIAFSVAVILSACTALADTTAVGFLTGAAGLGDDAFTDVTYSGLRKAQQKYRFHLTIEEPGTSGTVTPERFEKLLDQSDLLILLGVQYVDLADRYSRKHLNKRFINFDAPLEKRPNLISIVFKDHEGSFLAGALAAWMSTTGKVGFIGGSDYDSLHSFRVGYRQGARHADPEVELFETFIVKGPDASGFNMPKKAHGIAAGWYEQGVDIIYAAAGLSGNGVIHAARQYNRFAIGVDTDQDHMARGNVLTSMMKRLDTVIFREMSEIMENNFQAGVKYYGLKEHGVELSPMTYTRDLIPGEVMRKLEKAREDIISGKIKVNDFHR